ncbi:MAG: hypothetical protein BJ554DRAFT_3933 [Olpidium bornovanus]|uniref:Uncharacterized protein n=1 Tax=Olpidium bornovanus TaxID=278681 RepID=A0A8H8DFW3_9FUNG|nr:MAG: hypothetical protein BJ554DRAFT_3933 [Olpidium bornovanus]
MPKCGRSSKNHRRSGAWRERVGNKGRFPVSLRGTAGNAAGTPRLKFPPRTTPSKETSEEEREPAEWRDKRRRTSLLERTAPLGGNPDVKNVTGGATALSSITSKLEMGSEARRLRQREKDALDLAVNRLTGQSAAVWQSHSLATRKAVVRVGGVGRT